MVTKNAKIFLKFSTFVRVLGPFTVVFWGSEIWLEIFAQNPSFTIVKLEKKIKSEGKLW